MTEEEQIEYDAIKNWKRSTNAEILARRDINNSHKLNDIIYNSGRNETVICFVQYSEGGIPNYLASNNEFLFRDDDKLIMTSNLSDSYTCGNRIDQLPDFILEFCEKYDYLPKEVNITYRLVNP